MQDINEEIRSNLGLVHGQLRKMHLVNDQDAESAAYEALYKAILTFDSSKGYKLTTYATCCIYNALGSHIRMLNKKRKLEVLSYNNILRSEDGEDHEYLDSLADTVLVEQEYLRGELREKIIQAFTVEYEKLGSDKKRRIVLMWHSTQYSATNKEIAESVGVSQPYVNQVLGAFRAKLKTSLEAYYRV